MRIFGSPAFGQTYRKPDFDVSKHVGTPSWYKPPSAKFQTQVERAMSNVLMAFSGSVRRQILQKGLHVWVWSESPEVIFKGASQSMLKPYIQSLLEQFHSNPESRQAFLRKALELNLIQKFPKAFETPKQERQYFQRLFKKMSRFVQFQFPQTAIGQNIIQLGEKGFKKMLKDHVKGKNVNIATELETMFRHEIFHLLDSFAKPRMGGSKFWGFSKASPQFRTVLFQEIHARKRQLNRRLNRSSYRQPLASYLPATARNTEGMAEAFTELGLRLSGHPGTCTFKTLPPVFPKTSKLIEDSLKRLFKVRHLFARV